MRPSSCSFVILAAIALTPLVSTVGCAAVSPSRAASAARERERRSLAQHRTLQIARLHDYAERGVFPKNLVPSAVPVHIFKDAFGTRCAVANLVHLDGQSDLVDRMQRERNDVVVADETRGALHDWVLSSGLTNEEVRRVQGLGFFGFENSPPGTVGFDVASPERDRLQEQLRVVEKQLVADTEASLEIATARRLEGSARVAQR